MASVSSLLETPFLKRTAQEMAQIQEDGRPLPFLSFGSLEISGDNTIVHCFNQDSYRKNDWICGCPDRNALFCFPCLLYGGNDQWTTTGFNDLVHLSTAMKKHEIGRVHMQNMLEYLRHNTEKTMDKTSTTTKSPNPIIKKNLQIMDAIIDTIKFCAFNSIPIYSSSEEDEDPFKELLMLLNPSDASILNYLQQEPFTNLDTLKSDILKAASEVVRDLIIEEIVEAQYVSLIVERGDSLHPKIIILRYLKDCNIIERVWRIVDRENMMTFVDQLVEDLRRFIVEPTTLISQSYDQLSVKKQEPGNKIYTKIQINFPHAHLVHFYNHDILDVISRVDDIQKYVSSFFCTIWGISQFMTKTENITPVFEQKRSKLYRNQNRNTYYNFEKCKIESVYLNKEAIIETMSHILFNCRDYPEHTLFLAEHKEELQDENFNHLLECFYKMMPHFMKYISNYKNCVDSVWNPDLNAIRSILTGDVPEFSSQDVSSENMKLSEIQVKTENDLDIQVLDITKVKIETEEHPEEDTDCVPTSYKRKQTEDDKKDDISIDIVHSVVSQLKELLKYRTNMFISQLVNPLNFSKFSCTFPDRFLAAATSNLHYFSAFDTLILQNELQVLYDQPDFRSLTSSCDVLKKIVENKMDSTLPETVKLLKIALTFPSSVDDPQRCFDTKNKVGNFLSSAQELRDVDCLVYFSCERDLIENNDDFNLKILNKLIEDPQRAEHLSEKDV